jgi:magnesium chelatase family protein
MALEALREPLESGRITLSRAARQAEFPARFQFVAAMNPCPCGWLGHPRQACRCTPDAVDRYQSRLSGPLLDRIDLQVEVPAMDSHTLDALPPGEDSATVAARVARARRRALQRQGFENGRLEVADLERVAAPDAAARRFGLDVAQRLGWSSRSWHRVLRVALTIEDLNATRDLRPEDEPDDRPGGKPEDGPPPRREPTSIGPDAMAEAVQFRRALPGR